MRIFEYIIATLLLVVGLGITNLLNDAVDTFRKRHQIKMHWIPIAWAGIVFITQMQYIWAIFELETLVKTWNSLKFSVLLLMALLLFVSGALVVPKTTDDQGRDAWLQFLSDGRWALLSLSCFFFFAFLSNPLLFGISLWLPGNVLELFMALFLILAQFSTGRRMWGWATGIFAVLTIVAFVMLSPGKYR